MARTVSRASDDGKSVAVPVPELEGEFVEHKADPADIAAARSIVPPSIKSLQDVEVADWVENLTAAKTIFSSPKGSFQLMATGYHGSVQTIDEAVRRDPYVLRAVQRGKIRFLKEEEAIERIAQLQDEPSENESHLSHLMESLGANASENTGLYKIDLPDEAEPKGRSQTPEQIWGDNNRPESPKNFAQHVQASSGEGNSTQDSFI